METCVSLLSYILMPVILLFHPLPLYINTHMRTTHTHAHTHPMAHIHTLAPSPSIGSVFRGTSSLSDRLDIFRSNNLSQMLRVAVVSPSALRTRWLQRRVIYKTQCMTTQTDRHTVRAYEHYFSCNSPFFLNSDQVNSLYQNGDIIEAGLAG